MKNILLFGLICILNIRCDPVDDKLVINNKTNQVLYYTTSKFEDISNLYQEGLSKYGVNINYSNYVLEINANSQERLWMHGNSNAWERYINRACEGGKLRLYTFNIDTLKKYSWRKIIDNNLYERRIELTVPQLDELKWEVVIN